MNAVLRVAYGLAGRVAAGGAGVAAHVPGNSKLLRSLRARRGLLTRYAMWAATARNAARPLLWMHAPSVGEGLQARPVLERLRQTRPDLQLAYTHYSPSAEPLARAFRDAGLADFADYLPWDTAAAVGQALDALRPSVLAFAKLNVWPVLVDAAVDRHVKLALVSATLSATSRRQSWWGAAILGDAYARLDAVGAIDADDAGRLLTLGVRHPAIQITGDTRYDQVWTRARRIDGDATRQTMLDAPRPTIVAGSTWPGDERVVLGGWWALRSEWPTLRLILAPHEPTAVHLSTIERWAATRHCPVARLGGARTTDALADVASVTAAVAETATADLILIDRVGVLAQLYAVADIAFVGGGFHGAGLHSVLEPAAFGAPVVFGPRSTSSRNAGYLLGAGAAAIVQNEREFAAIVARWLADPASRRDAGARGRQMVEAGLGAAERSVVMLEELLAGGPEGGKPS